MTMTMEVLSAAARVRGLEVVVWDTDALLGDACASLVSGTPRSAILSAVDAKVAVALVSEQTYIELGRIFPRAAQGHGVDAAELRSLIEREYLPRVRVVALPRELDGGWVPAVDDVADPDDVPHAQLARLVAPSSVYSHDRHLRRPGYAPPDRPAYDERLGHLATAVRFRLGFAGIAMSVDLAGSGVSAAVQGVARKVHARPIWASLGFAVVAAGVAAYVLRSSEARSRAIDVASKVCDAVGQSADRNESAWTALRVCQVPADPNPPIEARMAAFLARHPSVAVSEICIGLGQAAVGPAVVRDVLSSYASFVESTPGRWALGSVRVALGE